jgi:hypothetical protein
MAKAKRQSRPGQPIEPGPATPPLSLGKLESLAVKAMFGDVDAFQDIELRPEAKAVAADIAKILARGSLAILPPTLMRLANMIAVSMDTFFAEVARWEASENMVFAKGSYDALFEIPVEEFASNFGYPKGISDDIFDAVVYHAENTYLLRMPKIYKQILEVAALLGLPENQRYEFIDYVMAFPALMEITRRTAQSEREKLKQDWVKARRSGVKIPDFIKDKFIFELEDGTMHKGLLSRYEHLRRDFYAYQRHHELPEWLKAIPTESEWNDRQVATGKLKPPPPEEVRAANRDLRRVQRARQRGVTL